jgi:hypothetical protein
VAAVEAGAVRNVRGATVEPAEPVEVGS